MRNLAIIPTYSRPEMLWHCLERLSACREISSGELDIVVAVDNHIGRPPPSEEIEWVVRRFPGVGLVKRDPHRYRGNSFNVLTAYEEAWKEERERVFLVEDDVMVEPDFFRWHGEAQQDVPFCSIGVSRRGPGYCSLGVCFRREPLTLVVQHAVSAYFANMDYYCQTNFREGQGLGAEQDGLIARVMLKAKATARFAELAVARHVGDYGYNRGEHRRPTGSLEERYRAVAERVEQEVS